MAGLQTERWGHRPATEPLRLYDGDDDSACSNRNYIYIFQLLEYNTFTSGMLLFEKLCFLQHCRSPTQNSGMMDTESIVRILRRVYHNIT